MKPKNFFDDRFWLAIVTFIIMIPICALVVFVTIYFQAWKESLLNLALGIFLTLCPIYMCIAGGREAFPVLRVDPIKRVIKWYFFFRRIEMSFEDCRKVWVAYDEKFANLRGVFSEADARKLGCRICFLLDDNLQQNGDLISSMRIRKNFIKFMYSDKLAHALIECFPEEKIADLKGFYDSVQVKANTKNNSNTG